MSDEMMNAQSKRLEYSYAVGAPGEPTIYQVRAPGEEWRSVSEEEVKALGFWHDPRGGQYGVSDEAATPEQLSARDKGFYDPRPASGRFVAKRVILACQKCGKKLGHVDEYEKRLLYCSARTGRWSRGTKDLKCRDCFEPLEWFPIKAHEIEQAVERARQTHRILRVKIGYWPKRARGSRTAPEV